MKFTTKDIKNDTGNWGSSGNCAIEFTGAWRYCNCYYSNLNGCYGDDTTKGIMWFSWRGCLYSLFATLIVANSSIIRVSIITPSINDSRERDSQYSTVEVIHCHRKTISAI